jgi:hypothetical protein
MIQRSNFPASARTGENRCPEIHVAKNDTNLRTNFLNICTYFSVNGAFNTFADRSPIDLRCPQAHYHWKPVWRSNSRVLRLAASQFSAQ